MKLLKFSILFVTIVMPFFWVNQLQAREQHHKVRIENQYDEMLNRAVDDAVHSLRLTLIPDTEAGYEAMKQLRLDKEAALQSFWDTLLIHLDQVNDDWTKQSLEYYLPAFIVIGYNGVEPYSIQEYTSPLGVERMKHVWQIKQPYVYKDEAGRIYSFTLDDYVQIYDPNMNETTRGYARDLTLTSSIPLVKDLERFDTIRRQTIIGVIQQTIESSIQVHNEQLMRLGVHYNFTLPMIPEEQWQNTIDDVGVLAFLQGLPIGHSRYNNYALGASKIVRRTAYYGTRVNGVKAAYPEACRPAAYEEVLQSAKHAAEKGYYPKLCTM